MLHILQRNEEGRNQMLPLLQRTEKGTEMKKGDWSGRTACTNFLQLYNFFFMQFFKVFAFIVQFFACLLIF